MFDNNTTFGFIGLGLIGGSVARLLRHNYPDCVITAYNRHKEKNDKNLELAKEERTLTNITTDLKEICKADCIFLCAPVLTNISYLGLMKPYISKNTMITDVGSVKNDIVKEIYKLGLSNNFIGGHPMTGMEKTGYENSSLSLLRGSFYIITPTTDTPSYFTETLNEFALKCGCKPFVVSPERHDEIVAGISHAPHVIAASLVNMVRILDTDGNCKKLAAGGFKDITRIASSSPKMWHDICISNKTAIINVLKQYDSLINNAIQAIDSENDDEIYELFLSSKNYRDNVD